MTKIRNQTVVKQVMARDLGVCRCCGLQASVVHHIVPIVYGGEDKPSNMVAICCLCHRHSPDKKNDFVEYMNNGGAATYMFYGLVFKLSEKMCKPFQEILPLSQNVLGYLKEFAVNIGIEKYNLKGIEQIEKADFTIKSELEQTQPLGDLFE